MTTGITAEALNLAEGTVVGINVRLAQGGVSASASPLKIDVKGFKYDIGGERGIFTTIGDQAVTDDDTNYVYLDDEGALQINITGFPTDKTYIPLARVVCASGEVIAIHEERVLLASSSAVAGTCRIGFPVDAGIRGDGSSASSNNNVPSITFPTTGDPRNRWNLRPPQNYISGDLTLRLLASVSGTPGSTKVRWQFDWGFGSAGDSFPSGGTYPYSAAVSKDMSAISSDTWFEVTLTIPSGDFDNTEDMMYCWLTRDTGHADDDCTLTQHLHLIELDYTGYKVAGQAGQ